MPPTNCKQNNNKQQTTNAVIAVVHMCQNSSPLLFEYGSVCTDHILTNFRVGENLAVGHTIPNSIPTNLLDIGKKNRPINQLIVRLKAIDRIIDIVLVLMLMVLLL